MNAIKIEVELDWLDTEKGTVSDAIRDEVVKGIQDRLVQKVEKQAREAIETKIKEAVDKVSADFLIKVFEERLANIQIPVKSGTWGSDVEYLSLNEFVGRQYNDFLKRKIFDERGNRTDYERDAKYTIHEYFTRDLLGKELERKLAALIADARQKAEEGVLKSLDQSLRDQLSADIIKRLNIPAMLQSLQDKAAEFELSGGSQ